MKNTNKLLLVSMMLAAGIMETRGQNVFPTGVGTSVGIGTNAPASRLQVVGGDARFGSTTNYAQHGADGDLTFTGNADFLVNGNKYAFRFSGDQDYGLFFNQTSLRYEFRDATAAAVFYASTVGDGYFAKGVQIGNSTINSPGNIRWNGTDFEGYNGSVWKSFTVTGGGSETDPQVGGNTTNFVPKWNGSALVTGTIFDNATNVGIGTATPGQKLEVSGNIKATGTITATGGNSSNWNSSFGWGNHATQGYLTSESDPQVSMTTTNSIPVWNGSALVNSQIYQNSSAKVGIGFIPNPLYDLFISVGDISGSIATDFYLPGTGFGYSKNYFLAGGDFRGSIGYEEETGCVSIITNTDGTRSLNINTFTDNVGIRNISPAFALDVTGDIHTSAILRIGTERLSDGGAFTISSSSNIDHETDNLDGLGTSAKRWVDVWAVDGVINTSDEREKSNIKDLGYGIADVMKLRPVSYTWTKNPERGTKLGLIAQELQKVVPEVVRDWERKADEVTGERKIVPSARLGVMYDDIIPVLISGMQDQQAIILEQQNTIQKKSEELENMKVEIENLKAVVNGIQNTSNAGVIANSNATAHMEKATLEQNAPNPFSEKTTINYYIPTNVKNAVVKIYSLNGDAIKTINIAQTGKGSLEVNGGSLAAGTYTYQLILDSKTIDTKLMVITK